MLITALFMSAWGADLVLYGDEVRPVAVLARVAQETGRPPGGFEIKALGEWARSIPSRFSGGEVRSCTGDPVPRSQFEAWLDEAHEATQYFDSDRALGALSQFEEALPCASEVLSRDSVGRAFFLKGFIEHTIGNDEEGARCYADARSVDRLLRFDSSMSPDSVESFEDAVPDPTAVWVEIRPRPDMVWLDGEQVTYTDRGIQVQLGRHHVTVKSSATTAADITVDQGGALILPAMIGTELVAQIDQPSRRSALLQILAYADVERAYLSDVERVWLAERNSVRELGVEQAVIKEPKRRGRFTPAGLIVAGAGLAIGAAGAAVSAACEDCPAGPAYGMMGGGGLLLLTGSGIVIGDQVSDASGLGHGISIRVSGAF